MRLLLAFLICATSFGQQTDRIRATALTAELLDKPGVLECFSDLLRQGGYGFREVEYAAFLIHDDNERYRCMAWPFSLGYHRQQFRGAVPYGTIAIAHTHPYALPEPSSGDGATARRLALPIFVLTPRNIYLVTSRGERVPVVMRKAWSEAIAR